MIVDDVQAAVRNGGLFARDRPVVAMLSGGRDSICLLDVAVALLGREQVSALHVNYGLRESANDDERHCVSVCERVGVQLELVRAARGPATGDPTAGDPTAGDPTAGDPTTGNLTTGDSTAGSLTTGDLTAGSLTTGDPAAAAGGPSAAGAGAVGNVQAWARELRYSAAAELARKGDALMATGHTADDQVETILYRLAASPGRRALQGMLVSSGRLIRPLLSVTRAQTTAYCQALGLPWCEDESNEDDRYARTRVRAGLLPALRAVHPAADANVLRTAALLREETELLEGLVDQELQGRAAIAVSRLRELPAALARLVVVRLAEGATGSYVPQAGDRVQELLALGRRGGRAELHVGGRAGAVIEDGTLTMVKLPPRS